MGTGDRRRRAPLRDGAPLRKPVRPLVITAARLRPESTGQSVQRYAGRASKPKDAGFQATIARTTSGSSVPSSAFMAAASSAMCSAFRAPTIQAFSLQTFVASTAAAIVTVSG